MKIAYLYGSAALAACVAVMNPAIVSAQAVADASLSPGAPDPAAVAQLVSQLEAALGTQPETATVADIQGAMTFVLDQARQPINVVQAAIDQVLRTRRSRVATAALQRLRNTYGSGTGGTGGTGGTQTGNALGAGPQVGGGGSGTDYTGGQ